MKANLVLGTFAIFGCVLALGCGEKESPTAPTASTVTASISATSLTLGSASMQGGTSVQGTVTLSGAAPTGGATVTLTSSGAAASVPASLSVAAGASSGTFSISTQTVTTATAVTITASTGGQTRSAVLNLTSAATSSTSLASLAVEPSVLRGGDSTRGTVTLAGPAPSSGMVITLSSSTSDARLPGSITIVAGATTGTFAIGTGGVSGDSDVWITASAGGERQTARIRLVVSQPNILDLAGTWSGTLGTGEGEGVPISSWIATQSGTSVSGPLMVTPGDDFVINTTLVGTISGTQLIATFTVPPGSIPDAPACSFSGSGVLDAGPSSISGPLAIAFPEECIGIVSEGPTGTFIISLTR